MKAALYAGAISAVLCGAMSALTAAAQEARSGVDLRATVTGQAVASSESTEEPRDGSVGTAGFRSVAYPTWKINDNWTAGGALQFATRPFFYQDLSTSGYGAKGQILQATLNYARVSDKGSLLIRAGELSTAFGSFLLRYDDADNALVSMPLQYGYYYSPITTGALAGAQIDATRRRFDGRLQFANSSPANPRSLFARDQYGNWAGGAGYTIRQGFRVGVSGYRGPYLSRDYRYFFPGEAKPSSLPAHALGFDVAWARGHTSALGEVQKFTMPYKLIPTFSESASYGELKRVLNARWYVAGRVGTISSKVGGRQVSLEPAVGFRPNRHQMIKVGYEFEHYSSDDDHAGNTLAIQLVTTFHVAAAGRE